MLFDSACGRNKDDARLRDKERVAAVGVMPGLGPGIHEATRLRVDRDGVDGRVKARP
jgi:hypothetical protein